MTKALKLEGKKFNRLLVVKRVENDNHGFTRWLCKCDCGKYTTVTGHHLVKGNIKSCGCIKKEMIHNRKTNHFKTNTRIYKIWASAKSRCFDNNHKNYDRYKGRGITMCDEWKNNFMSFYNWAINNGYKGNLTLDRINNDGNYEPSNCRWVTRKQQANNTCRNRFITFNNETHTVSEWAEKIGIDSRRLEARILKGLTLERCFYKGKLSNNGVDFL